MTLILRLFGDKDHFRNVFGWENQNSEKIFSKITLACDGCVGEGHKCLFGGRWLAGYLPQTLPDFPPEAFLRLPGNLHIP